MSKLYYTLLFVLAFLTPGYGRAEFILNSAIIEFSPNGPKKQDIELISRSKEGDYIVSEIYEIKNPGTDKEERVLLENPVEAGLLVTPDKTLLPAGGRKIIRLVLLKEHEEKERIYRVAIKPVIRGTKTDKTLGLKILIGYEALVIVRPITPNPALEVTRTGRKAVINNAGNTNLLLQAIRQCPSQENNDSCKNLPVVRLYAGEKTDIALPFDGPIIYSLWDGNKTEEHKVE